MIPKIIHQCMLPNLGEVCRPLSAEELRLGSHMRRVMPDWEYRLWNQTEVDALVQEHFPQYHPIFGRIRRAVVRADICRYMYLFVHGGFYFDLDYKLIRPINEQILSHSCVLPISRGAGSSFTLGNAVMGSERFHPFWTEFIKGIFSTNDLANLPEQMVEEVTGPKGITNFYLANVNKYEDIYLPERSMFHPPHRFGGFSSQKSPETFGVHLSWGSWRTKNPLAKMKRILHRKLTSF